MERGNAKSIIFIVFKIYIIINVTVEFKNKRGKIYLIFHSFFSIYSNKKKSRRET